MPLQEIDKPAVIATLNRILEMELAGVVRYTHYSFMITGYNRIPIVGWMRGQATESLTHAQDAGEKITHLGEHPSLAIGHLLETHKHDIGDILRESLEHEKAGLGHYKDLLDAGRGAVDLPRGVRAADDPRGGDARRGSREDAEKTGVAADDEGMTGREGQAPPLRRRARRGVILR